MLNKKLIKKISVPSNSFPQPVKLPLNYQRVKQVDIPSFQHFLKNMGNDVYLTQESTVNYQPYDVCSFQYYYPHYKVFFEMTPVNCNQITFNHRCQLTGFNRVYDTVLKRDIETPIFIKFAPLLDPLRFLTGKYLDEPKTKVLPSLDSTSETCYDKFLDIHNASYVDCFFSFLVSRYKEETGFKHGIDFYGTYMGIQRLYRYDMIDDIEYLRESKVFNENPGLYEMDPEELALVLEKDDENDDMDSGNSRKNRKELIIGEENTIDLGIEELLVENLDIDNADNIDNKLCVNLIDSVNCENDNEKIDEIVENDTKSECGSSSCYESTTDNDSSSLNSLSDNDNESENSDKSENNKSSNNDSDSSSGSGSGSSDCEYSDPKLFVYLKDFPVQMICQERCVDTLDNLIVNKIIQTDEEIVSALIQVIMILIEYQRQFQFTHNDLHTSNIMYQNTDEPFLDYTVGGQKYRIPTYGRIYKLIDFGRAIYTYEGMRFCSDSYSKGGDAYSQYNTEPYYNPEKERVEPNYSFDLCRLACSLYDIIDDDFKDSRALVDLWIQDDFGKNVLYKRNGEERYHDFKLYKMISRTVHNHVPFKQLRHPVIAKYKI